MYYCVRNLLNFEEGAHELSPTWELQGIPCHKEDVDRYRFKLHALLRKTQAQNWLNKTNCHQN